LFQVLALKGSYHGDTLGAMEAQAPSSYTGFLQQPWYEQFVTKACAESLQIYFFYLL
jgi:adenosylmethionine-8-amino-7-oxononanoate aminotransferase